MDAPFEARTERCQDRLVQADAAGLVAFPGPNVYYLAGVHETPSERHFLLFIPATGPPVLLVPELAEARVADETWIADVRSWSDEDDPRRVVESIGQELDLTGRVLVDDHLWATVYRDLETALPATEFGLASTVLEDLRIRKDDTEIDALLAASRLTDTVAESIRELGASAIGMTETDIAREIEDRQRDQGAARASFEPIVGSGPNGARPHHTHGDRRIEPGDPVVLDFGCVYDHYVSDQTRTIVFDGTPPDRFEEVVAIVRDAQDGAVEAIEPGVPAEVVDRAARAVIEDAGYEDAFIHRTGHGVGLEVHEPPYIVRGNDRRLEPGMVFSVEPGIYLEGRFGVRIEDLVAVTDDGATRLNDTPRGWRPDG